MHQVDKQASEDIKCNRFGPIAEIAKEFTQRWHSILHFDEILDQTAIFFWWFQPVFSSCGVRRKFSWGGLVHGRMVAICIWCALFVTAQFYITSMFPNQHFGEVCWHNMHIFSTSTPFILCVIALNINYQRSKLGYRRKINSTLRHSSSYLQKYQPAR